MEAKCQMVTFGSYNENAYNSWGKMPFSQLWEKGNQISDKTWTIKICSAKLWETIHILELNFKEIFHIVLMTSVFWEYRVRILKRVFKISIITFFCCLIYIDKKTWEIIKENMNSVLVYMPRLAGTQDLKAGGLHVLGRLGGIVSSRSA